MRRRTREDEKETRIAGLLGPEFTAETAITSIARHGYIAAPKTVSCLSRCCCCLSLTFCAYPAISGMRFSFLARTPRNRIHRSASTRDESNGGVSFDREILRGTSRYGDRQPSTGIDNAETTPREPPRRRLSRCSRSNRLMEQKSELTEHIFLALISARWLFINVRPAHKQ